MAHPMVNPAAYVGMSNSAKRRLLGHAYRDRYDVKEVENIVWELGEELWKELRTESQVRLGPKGKFLSNFMDKYRHK